MLYFDVDALEAKRVPMINRIRGGTGSDALMAGALSVGLAAILLSACDRREVSSNQRASPSSVATTTAAAPFLHSTAGESSTPANAVRPSTENDEAGQSSEPAIAVTDGSLRSAIQGEEAVSHMSRLVVPAGRGAITQSETMLTPLVAVGSNPALKFNARQIEEAVKLGQEFLAAMDKTPTVVQVPAQMAASADDAKIYADASVHVAWRSAQEESDALFRAKFGYSAFNAQLLMRAQQAYNDRLAAQQ